MGTKPLPAQAPPATRTLMMAEERPGHMSVATGVVRQTLVEHTFAQAEERREQGDLPEAVAAVLESSDEQFAVADEALLDRKLRHAGYATRLAEAEMFEPARQPADWLASRVTEQFERTGSWGQAVRAVCGELARAEPLGKPSPNDETAMTWRVPGPGGHVRHYVARRAIEDYLQNRARPLEGDPAELKRPWLYGFFVRACEEALPPGAALEPMP